jgi:hypothetical protein
MMDSNSKRVLFSFGLIFFSLLTRESVGFSAEKWDGKAAKAGSGERPSDFNITITNERFGKKLTLKVSRLIPRFSTDGIPIAGGWTVHDVLLYAGLGEDLKLLMNNYFFTRQAPFFPPLKVELATPIEPVRKSSGALVFEVYIVPIGVTVDKDNAAASVLPADKKELKLELAWDDILSCDRVIDPNATQNYLVRDIYNYLRSRGYQNIYLKLADGSSRQFCADNHASNSGDDVTRLDPDRTIGDEIQSHKLYGAGSLDTVGGSVDSCFVRPHGDNGDNDNQQFEIHAYRSSRNAGDGADDS